VAQRAGRADARWGNPIPRPRKRGGPRTGRRTLNYDRECLILVDSFRNPLLDRVLETLGRRRTDF